MQFLNLHDYEVAARACLDTMTWDYIQGGSGDEVTLAANRSAFERLRLRPRVLVDVSNCDVRTTALGIPLTMPVMVAPVGCQCIAHAEGECATASVLDKVGSLMVVSTMSTQSIEAIAARATGPLWFQSYIFRNRAVSESLIRRAEAAGYRAIVVTVDAPYLGQRERDMRNGFGLAAPLRFANFDDNNALASAHTPGSSGLAVHARTTFDPSFTWSDLHWIRSITRLPILLKGVLTAEDARCAVEHGVAGIIVSNHGGRQLDGAVATIEALPEVVDAVGGRCEVYLDGGIRRGSDIVKALAFGARAVMIGRPVLWGLAVGGAAGVAQIFELLRAELELAMALLGRPTIHSIDRTSLQLKNSW